MELCQTKDFACNRHRAEGDAGEKMSSDKQLDRRDLMSRFFKTKEAHPEKMNDMDVFSISHGAM